MLKQITGVYLTKAESEFEALLLEASYIHRLTPKYNSRLKDDKSPIYIVITKDEYPKIVLKRKQELSSLKGYIFSENIFGPFLSERQVKSILGQIRKILPYCSQNSKSRRARLSARRACFYTHIELCPGACIGKISAKSYRSVIKKIVKLLNGEIGKLKNLVEKEMKKAAKNYEFELAAQKKEILRGLDNILSFQTKEGKFGGENNNSANKLNQLIKLLIREGIRLDYTIDFKIEGYDISHLGGIAATASMVVFVNGEPDTRLYRQFRLREKNTRDDPRMLAEVLQRRLTHPEWDYPSLILIDGGEPQLAGIQKELRVETTLINRIPFIGLVKGEERIVIPTGKNIFRSASVGQKNLGVQTLMAVRDESHRFARRYHHLLKNRL